MNLFFQNPLWALGLLAAVPLLAHLFSRTRPRRREFPSLRLIHEAMRRVTRVRRPRERWLLLLRTLAMAALIGAFLQPWLRTRHTQPSASDRALVLLIDATASMAFADGTRTRLAQAAAAADQLLASLPAGSLANIVWLQSQPASVLPEPGPNIAFLREALQRAVAKPEAGDIAIAWQLAEKQLAASTAGHRELAVISDFQKSAWREASWQTAPGIALTRLAVGETTAANVALAGLAIEPARPVIGEPARIVCRVRNFSPEPRRATLLAAAGESRLSQAVEVPPWSETLAVLPVTFSREGLAPIELRLNEDRFPGDDVRHALCDVRGATRVLIAGDPGDPTAAVWHRAARALGGVEAARIPLAEAASAPRADLLMLAGWRGEAAEPLRARVESGSALVVQPGAGLPAGAFSMLAGVQATASDALGMEIRDAPGWAVRIARENHPVFRLFQAGAYGDPAGALFRRRIATPPLPPGQALLAFADDRPALHWVDGGAAPLLWWNLDLGSSDWAAQTPFVSFFGEVLREIAARAGGAAPRETPPGDVLRFEAGPAIDPADVHLVDERDQGIEVAPESPRTPNRIVSKAAPPPGSYRWMAQGSVLDRAVINFPEEESDLRQLTTEELEARGGAIIANAGRAEMATLREGRPLWPWLLGAAAFFLLLEAALLNFLPAPLPAGVAPRPAPAPSHQRKLQSA
jgi:hypothetical protein